MLPPRASDLKTAIVLIGHGAPATDCPPQLIGELMSLEWRKNGAARSHGPHHLEGRAAQLDAAIRDWPRHPGNDPYKVGLERLAEALRGLVPSAAVAVGYNEFCRPSIPEAIEQVIRQGATRVLVIPSMLTPGGVHAEIDIPRALDALRPAHPAVSIEYVWPFHLAQVAALLASHVQGALAQPAGGGAR